MLRMNLVKIRKKYDAISSNLKSSILFDTSNKVFNNLNHSISNQIHLYSILIRDTSNYLMTYYAVLLIDLLTLVY